MVTSQGLKANGKIFLLISILTGVFLGAGYLLGGTGGMAIGLLLAGAMNTASYWFSDRIVLKMYSAEEITEEENLEIHRMVENRLENIEKTDI